jgi:hypothetical protein
VPSYGFDSLQLTRGASFRRIRLKRKTARNIKDIYIRFIKSAPDTIKYGVQDILFVYLYLYIKQKVSRKELISKMRELGISGLAMSYLVEESERKRNTLNRYKLPEKYGL